MGKKIRFPLEMENGVEVRSMTELREQFSLYKILDYVENGKLVIWLRDRYENKIADEIEKLDLSDSELARKVSEIFEIPFDENTERDLEKAAEREEKIERLKEYTDEQEYFDVIDNVAFEQEELYDLLDEDKDTIYLCGKQFSIPLSKSGVAYIGINTPIVVVDSKVEVDWDEIGISVEGVQFDEKYQELLACKGDEEATEIEKSVDLSENAREEIRSFGQDMWECISDFKERYRENETELEDGLDYDFDDLLILDSEDYGSRSWEYDTKADAKVACKEQLEEAFDAKQESCKEECNVVVEAGETFISEIAEIFQEFLDEFEESYDKYVSLIDDEEAVRYLEESKKYIIEPKEMRESDSDQVMETSEIDYNQRNITNGMRSNIAKLIGLTNSVTTSMKSITGTESERAEEIDYLGIYDKYQKLIEKELPCEETADEYFNKCTYFKDDDSYYFDMDDAISEIESDLSDLYISAGGDIASETVILCNEAVYDYCEELQEKLKRYFSI